MPAVETASAESPVSSVSCATIALSHNNALYSLADVMHAGTAEPRGGHGQRPGFQLVMTKDETRMRNVQLSTSDVQLSTFKDTRGTWPQEYLRPWHPDGEDWLIALLMIAFMRPPFS